MRYLKGSITYLSCLLTEDSTQETLLSSKLSLSLRSNLTDKDITGTYLSTDTDDTTLIQILQSVIADTRNVTCDLFRSQLGITGLCLIFFNMDRCINIILYKFLTEQNSILVVITLPGHKSDQRVLTKRKLTIGCRRAISDNLSCLNMLTLEHDRSLVVAVALVASHKFCKMIIIFCSVIILDRDICRCGTKYCTCFSCNNAYTGVNGCLGLHTSTNNRSLCCKKRNGLTLHVGSHQRTVRIIVLQERNQGCSNREYHSWRYIHVIKHVLLVLLCLLTVTSGNVLMKEMSLFVQRLIRLCYMIIIFLVRCHVYNFICYTRVGRICFINFSVRSLYETVLIDSCIRCKGVDKTNVRSLRSLDRAHSSIVGIMYVSNLESGSVS